MTNLEQIARIAALRQAMADGTARKIRERAHISQAEAAAAAGVSRSAVSLWEADVRRPRGAAALRYAALLEALSKNVQVSA